MLLFVVCVVPVACSIAWPSCAAKLGLLHNSKKTTIKSSIEGCKTARLSALGNASAKFSVLRTEKVLQVASVSTWSTQP